MWARDLAPGFYFYEHIAKTGGTSWSKDIARSQQLAHCGVSHLVGPGSVQTLNASLTAAVASSSSSSSSSSSGSGSSSSSSSSSISSSSSSRTCNLFNREDTLASSLRVFAWAGGVEPRIILLLRQPITHVASMYSHCQGPTGWLRREREAAGTFKPIGFAAWLRLFDGSSSGGANTSHGNNGWRAGWPHCYYNPANYQSHLLIAPAGTDGNADGIFPGGRLRMPASRLAQLRELLQRRAFFVGVTEHYAASLCLLKAKLRGYPSGGYTYVASGNATTGRAREQAACVSETQTTMSHVDYGNSAGGGEQAATALMTDEVLARTEALTQVDQLAYALALDRLFREAEQAGVSLLGLR